MAPMEITIGIRQVARELTFESPLSADEIAAEIAKALDGAVLDLADTKGRRVVVPSDAIGYVEMGAESQRPIGFASA